MTELLATKGWLFIDLSSHRLIHFHLLTREELNDYVEAPKVETGMLRNLRQLVSRAPSLIGS